MPKKTRLGVGLNIDWDFFFEQEEKHPNHDWGHAESPFYYSGMMWAVRFSGAYAVGEDLQKTYTADRRWRTLWTYLKRRGFNLDNATVIFADSNLGAWYVFDMFRVSHIYNFDNHHDVFYRGGASENIDCGNWLGQTMREQPKLGATIVYPDRERLEWEFEFENPRANRWVKSGRLDATTYDELEKGRRDVDAIFICRSGAWTPPWDDEKFMQLVRKTPNAKGEFYGQVYIKDYFGDHANDTVHPEEVRGWNRRDAVKNGNSERNMFAKFRKQMEKARSSDGP
jgi:hypothetical protein